MPFHCREREGERERRYAFAISQKYKNIHVLNNYNIIIIYYMYIIIYYNIIIIIYNIILDIS